MTILSAAILALAFAAPPSPAPALFERPLEDIELEFVCLFRFGGDPAAERSHCFHRSYAFTRDGYRVRSTALDPVVTMDMQVETGAVLPGGQDLTVLYDGEVELHHEDLPGTDQDHVVISPTPTFLGDEDPRRFGLLSVLFRHLESAEPQLDGSFLLRERDGTKARARMDAATGACERLEVLTCDGSIAGEYRFSDFRWIEPGEGRSPILFPLTTELMNYGRDGKRLVYAATYLLQDVHAVTGLDFAREIRTLEITPSTLVMDHRFVPVANYLAGRNANVTLASLWPPAPKSEPASASTSGEAPPEAARSATPLRSVGLAAILGLVAALTWARRSRPATVAAQLLAIVSISTPDTRAAGVASIEIQPRELSVAPASIHDVVRREITVHNPGDERVTLAVESTLPSFVAWPRQLVLESGASERIVVRGVVPGGTADLDGAVRLRTEVGEAREVAIRVTRATATATPVAAAPAAAPPRERPILDAAAYEKDLGVLLDDKPVEFAFELKNVGSQVLEIGNVHAECGCTRAEVRAKTVAPGGVTLLAVTFDPENRIGPLERRILVTSNDPVTPLATFTLRADVRPEIAVEPRMLDLGTLAPGARSDGIIAFAFAHGVRKIDAVQSNGLTLVDHAILEDGAARRELAVVLLANAPDGPFEGELRVSFEGRQYPLRIPYRGVVKDVVRAAPDRVGFPFIDAADPALVHAEFGISGDGEGRVLAVEHDANWIEVEAIAPRAGEAARYRVTPAKSVSAGFLSATIALKTTWRAAPLLVPVVGFAGDRSAAR